MLRSKVYNKLQTRDRMAIFLQTMKLINPKPTLRGNSEVKDTTSNMKHFNIEITFFLSVA